MTLLIRPAHEDDAPLAVEVLRSSVRELCSEDHRDDPAEIACWLENKTVETWSAWVDHHDASVLVAEEDGIVCGVGMVRSDGEILLNYVSPKARFRGVSKALLSAMEKDASVRGTSSTTLQSTHTAQRFYLANGYIPKGDLHPLRMTKSLPARG